MTPIIGAVDVGVLTDLGADVGTLATAGFTLAGLVLAGIIGIKLIKKFASRAT